MGSDGPISVSDGDRYRETDVFGRERPVQDGPTRLGDFWAEAAYLSRPVELAPAAHRTRAREFQEALSVARAAATREMGRSNDVRGALNVGLEAARHTIERLRVSGGYHYVKDDKPELAAALDCGCHGVVNLDGCCDRCGARV